MLKKYLMYLVIALGIASSNNTEKLQIQPQVQEPSKIVCYATNDPGWQEFKNGIIEEQDFPQPLGQND